LNKAYGEKALENKAGMPGPETANERGTEIIEATIRVLTRDSFVEATTRKIAAPILS
jgi:AcrR family transcriptional regulator